MKPTKPLRVARLIAAAPKLLASARRALVYMLAEPTRDETAVALMHELDAAIVTATGGKKQ